MRKVIVSSTYSIIAAAMMLVLFYSLWFGLTLYRRKHPAHSEEGATEQDGRQFAS
jgi:hypothetical protein